MHTPNLLLAICVSLGLCNESLAQRIPIQFRYGWGTEIQRLSTVPADAALAADFEGDTVHLSYKWDELWFGFPFWIANSGYIIEVVSGDAAPSYYELKEQKAESIANIAGVSPALLSPPLFSRLPFGYVVLTFAFIVVTLTSGPSPRKRFVKLIQNPLYQCVLRRLATLQHEFTPLETDSDGMLALDRKMQQWYAESIELLVENGVSRNKAERHLQFMLGYLQSHPHEAAAFICT